jgi:hypothetical protein
MTIEQTIEIPVSHRVTLDVPQEVPEGKVKVAFSPLSDAAGENFFPHKLPGTMIFSPDKKPGMTPQEATDRMCGMLKGSKFTVDALLEERRRDLEREKE